MNKSQLPGVLTPILAQFDLELEAVEVIPAGKRQLLRVVVDGDGPNGTGPLLDEIAEASKAMSAALDSSRRGGQHRVHPGGQLPAGSIGRSSAAAHWRRNRGPAGRGDTYRRGAGSPGGSWLPTSGRCSWRSTARCASWTSATVSKALVQVELNRPSRKIETSDGEED